MVGPKILDIFKRAAACFAFKVTHEICPHDFFLGNNKYFTTRNSGKYAMFFVFLYLTDVREALKFVKNLNAQPRFLPLK